MYSIMDYRVGAVCNIINDSIVQGVRINFKSIGRVKL